MCMTCGCSEGNVVTIEGENGEHTHVMPDGTVVSHSHDDGHAHAHDHDHDHHHHAPAQVEALEQKVLAKNDRLAERNRGWFAGRGVLALNMMSSPGSGKTTLLERTLNEVPAPTSVIEGDQETARDAERLRATGAPVIQVNTGTGCHLEADMVWLGIQKLDPKPGSALFIENVGNLVCPALFDLGEAARVVLFSVTEGEDKPLKYPHMFRSADLVLLTKVDLLPHLDFDVEEAKRSVSEVAPDAPILLLSAKSGVGLESWFDWIASRRGQRG